jgi:PTH1 family peptidyl-tRNA hydrolase
MYRIVGLWNNEEKYQDTPHNIGGQILAEIFRKKDIDLIEKVSELFFSSKRKARISTGVFCSKDFEIILPECFMNESGNVFSGVFSKENEGQKENIIVIYDDIALPFGKIKVSFDRGDGGHNGIKDIEKKVGTKKFARIRVGVCPLDFFGNPRKPKGEAALKYLVGKKFSKKYLKKVQEAEGGVGEVLESILKNGLEKTMNKFN